MLYGRSGQELWPEGLINSFVSSASSGHQPWGNAQGP